MGGHAYRRGLIPRLSGALQDVSVDFSGDVKQLYGQNQFAYVARGKVKSKAKPRPASLSQPLQQSLLRSDPVAGPGPGGLQRGGRTLVSSNTVTAANAANFIANLGAYYAATGVKLEPGRHGPGRRRIQRRRRK